MLIYNQRDAHQSVKKLPPSFYEQPTLDVATALLGKVLVRVRNGTTLAGKIVETEGYIADIDNACHAYRGMTERNKMMFGKAGTAYVYFTYGNHFMLNVVTEPEGKAAAVLIRALEPLKGLDEMKSHRGVEKWVDLTNGPGKLTQAMGIDRALNGISLQSNLLYIADGETIARKDIVVTARVGISQSKELPWRFYINENKFVSKGKPSAEINL